MTSELVSSPSGFITTVNTTTASSSNHPTSSITTFGQHQQPLTTSSHRHHQTHHHHHHYQEHNSIHHLQYQGQQQQVLIGMHPGGGGGIINNNNNFVIVELHRDDVTCPSFGFNIKGGAETGCPVYIWRVEPGSLADRSGLKSGDEIVQANGISFGGITHAEALKVLKGQTTLTLYIKAPGGNSVAVVSSSSSSPPQPPPPLPPARQRMLDGPQQQQQNQQQSQQHMLVGTGALALPSSQQQSPLNVHHRVEYYTWVDRHGNPVPPPNPADYPPERLINLGIDPGQNLGLMIRGGCEYGLGIYVTGVDPGSVAERVGLQRGDEILSVNNKNFTRITHDKAVQILKSSKHMQIVASYIGKIPADLNDEDLLKLDSSGEGTPGGNGSSSGVVVGGGPVGTAVGSSSGLFHTGIGIEEEDCESEIADRVAVGREVVDVVEEEVEDMEDEARELDRMDNELDLDFVGDRSGDGSGNVGNSTIGSSKRCTTSILQMIEEKARTVLNKSEHSRFTFYRIEYMQGFLPVVAFVRILLELLNTHEKYTLLTEVRELIRATDLHQFDELIYNKSHSFRVSSSSTSSSVPLQPAAPPPQQQQQQQSITSSSGVVVGPQQQIPTSSIYNNNNALISSTVAGGGGNPMLMGGNNQQQQPGLMIGGMQQQQAAPLTQQQPAGALPPPPQPPPNFIHHHGIPPPPVHQQHQDIGVDELVDDFIEHPGVGGNMNDMVLMPGGECANQQGLFNGGPWRGNVPNQNAIVEGVVDRQLLITHDPAALTMSHPQILNSSTSNSVGGPGGLVGQQLQQQQQGRMHQPTSAPCSSSCVTTTTTNAIVTPSKLTGSASVGCTGNNLLLSNTNLINPTTSIVNNTGPVGASSSVPAVRFKVRINKVKPILGIAIEGGSNTPHRLPRIIDVNPDGSAFHSNLRAGQVLLTVDGKKLDGLTHEEIARLILDCYVDMTKSQIEFLVVEAKQNYYYFNTQQQNI